jgi:hypothetical protein
LGLDEAVIKRAEELGGTESEITDIETVLNI